MNERIKSYVDGMIENARRECASAPVDGLMIMCRVEGFLSGTRESNPDVLSEPLYRELIEKVEIQQTVYRNEIRRMISNLKLCH